MAERRETPRGELAIRTLAMPADTNPSGDIFGGWVLSQMDIAGGVTAQTRAHGRVVTAAVEAMSFHRAGAAGGEEHQPDRDPTRSIRHLQNRPAPGPGANAYALTRFDLGS